MLRNNNRNKNIYLLNYSYNIYICRLFDYYDIKQRMIKFIEIHSCYNNLMCVLLFAYYNIKFL